MKTFAKHPINQRRRCQTCSGLVALFLSLWLSPRASALDPARSVFQYNCQSWTRQDGLPANGVSAILQDKDGYLWLGTIAGPVRFDGINFDLIDLSKLPEFRATETTSFAVSKTRGVWAGIRNSGVALINGKKVSLLEGSASEGMNRVISSMVEGADGDLFVASQGQAGRVKGGKIYESILPPPGTDSYYDVRTVHRDSQGRVWFGTTKAGLYVWQAGVLSKFPDPALDDAVINAVAVDPQGVICVGTQIGLVRYNSRYEKLSVVLSTTEIHALLVDRHGVLWAGTGSGGLLRCQGDVVTQLRKTDGLADDFVTALAEDQEGSLWVGTRNGLSQLSDVKIPTFGKNEGLTADVNISVVSSRRGGIWVATSSGFTYFDGGTNIQAYSSEAGLSNAYIMSLLEAKNGDIYLATGAMEILVFSGGKIVARYPHKDYPTALVEDAQGVVAAVDGKLYRVSASSISPYLLADGQQAAPGYLFNMIAGRDGSIWIANAGLGIMQLKNGVINNWPLSAGSDTSSTFWVHEDEDGTVWASSTLGIARLKNNQLRMITKDDGLFDNVIFALVLDDHDQFWADGSRGIFRVSRQALNDFADGKTPRVECVVYDSLSAVKGVERNQQKLSGCKSLDGRIWFPIAQGVLMIDPTNLAFNRVPPRVHIDAVRANGRELGRAGDVVVPPGKGELEFQYVGLSFAAPEKIHYRYKLEGYDKDWVKAGDRRMAFYTNLKPGRYTFRVIAANAEGIWNYTGDSLTLELRPHFYQTGWFSLLCGGLGLAALGGIYAWRVRHLTRKQAALQKARDLLEAEVTSRTAELAESKALYHSLVEQLPTAIFRKDKEGRYTFGNASFGQVLGLTADQIVGRLPSELMTRTSVRQRSPEAGKLGAQGLSHHQAIMQTGRQIEVEDVYFGVEGTPRYFHTVKSAVFGSEGQIIGTQGILFDITQRKQAEAELTYERELLAALLDHSPDPIYFKDAQSRFLKASKAQAELFGLKSAHELLGRTDFDFFMDASARPAFEDEQEIIRTGRPLIGKVEKEVLKNGRESWALTSKMPLRNKDGQIIGTFGISKDITAIKETESKLEQLHQQLLETSRLAGMAEVASNVLHNVGNVLNSVNVSSTLLFEQFKKSKIATVGRLAALLREHAANLGEFLTTDPKGQRIPVFLGELAAHLAAEQAAALAELMALQKNIEHIKDIVAMQQSYAKVGGVTQLVALPELFEEALRMNERSLLRHEVQVIREYDPALPEIILDKHKVMQILVNLIRNAKHACQDAARGNRRLTVRVANGESRIKMSVRDNGVGIPPENLTRIFSHGFTTKKDGHGFGLHSGALAAKEMGGALTVRSDGPGKGATFTLELPCNKNKDSNE